MKNQKLTCSILMLFLVSIIIFVGCQQEEPMDSLNDKEAYLSLSPNVDFNNLTEGDWEIISQAFTRLDLRENEDGLFEIPHKSGKEINMSDELFKYFQDVAENSNEKILSEVYYTRNKLRTTREGDTPTTNTDCVARCIAYATGGNYYEINSWIVANYGANGVPPDKFYFVMNHFCDGAQVGLSMFNSMNISYNSKEKYVIVINLSHAVNLEVKSGNSIMYWDPQAGEAGFCVVSDITHIYEVR